MSQLVVKAGATFNFSGVVSYLAPATAWSAQSFVRDASGAQIAALTCALVEAMDYSTSDDWILTLSATATQTAAWLDPATPFDAATLYCDVQFSAADEVIFSDTFVVLVAAPVTATYS